ncbi:MAG: hypothetical protein PUB33_05055, partial [Ligilactobacillus ruminis]|nr:hypothetical protein [Ligilactobacillus ruminis]
MCDFCLLAGPNSGRAGSKVEQNSPKLKKCSTADSKFGPRGSESRTKSSKILKNVLPLTPNSARAAQKVEQNHPKLRKCSTQLPLPKQCESSPNLCVKYFSQAQVVQGMRMHPCLSTITLEGAVKGAPSAHLEEVP